MSKKNEIPNSSSEAKTGDWALSKSVAGDILPVLQWWIPKIGQKIDSIDITKQFGAVLATSRMQKDYEMAANLTNIINKDKNNPNYDFMLAVALLNQAQLFEFIKPMEQDTSTEEDHRDNKLWNTIQSHLKKNLQIFDNDQTTGVFGERYTSILVDFVIKSKNMKIIRDCLVLIWSLDKDSQEYIQLQSQLEKSYMENSIQKADINMLDDVFLQDIWIFYDDSLSGPITPDADPDYSFPDIITRLVNSYICDPLFVLEQYNKEARKQIWKYGVIRQALNNVLTKVSIDSKYDSDDLNKFFSDEGKADAKPIFEKLLKKDLNLAIAEKEIYSGLMKSIKDHKDFFEVN